jgi:uncharacterized protein (DUF2336 family)
MVQHAPAVHQATLFLVVLVHYVHHQSAIVRRAQMDQLALPALLDIMSQVVLAHHALQSATAKHAQMEVLALPAHQDIMSQVVLAHHALQLAAV